MKIVMIGDITGQAGIDYLGECLPQVIAEKNPDLIIANAENAMSNGRGINRQVAEQLYDLGVEFLTMGNHVWDHKDAFTLLQEDQRIVRPANMAASLPGRGHVYCKVHGQEVAIVNIIGRTYMNLSDCPFQTMDHLLDEISKRTPFIIVDFHAEVTSEKLAMGYYLDGKVSAVIGTHTHVQTADEQILSGQTAYLTDVGMTGPAQGILGVDKSLIIERFRYATPVRFELAKGSRHFHAVYFELDKAGRAVSIERIRYVEKDRK
nr:TIGR00282 family metallophosphoesterase [Bacilli bacterium]